MNKTSKIIVGVIVVVLIIWVVVAGVSKNSQPQAGDTIKIGAVIALTGAGATNGEDIKKGMDLAVKDLDAKGINVAITYEDDQTNPKESVSAVQKILATDKPDAFVGPIWSFLLDATLPVIDQVKIVTFSPCSSSEYINTKTPYVFFGYVRNALRVEPAAKWLKEISAKNVAVIVSKDAWGDSNERAFVQAVSDAGAKVALIERIAFGGELGVLPSIFTKVKAAKADAILWTGYDDGAAVFIKKLHELAINVPVLGTDGFKSVTAKGIVSLNASDRVYVFDTPKNAAFAEKFKQTYGIAPGECADTAYDGLMILVEGIKNAKSETLADYLRNRTNYKGYAHEYDFDESGDVAGGEWVIRKL